MLGVTVEQVLEWDDLGAPVVAERYLLLWSKKHLGIEWDGWMISRGKLRHKKLMWRPDTLLANRRDAEKTWLLEYELKRLQTWTGVFRTIGKLSKTAASGFVSRV